MMRLQLAPTSVFTDARGDNKKARHRARHAGEQAGTAARAVVNSSKPTGVSGCTLAPVSLQRIRVTGHMKLASALSPVALGKARYGADNERSADRQTNPSNSRSDRRLLDRPTADAAAVARNDAATGIQAAQTDCRTWRERNEQTTVKGFASRVATGSMELVHNLPAVPRWYWPREDARWKLTNASKFFYSLKGQLGSPSVYRLILRLRAIRTPKRLTGSQFCFGRSIILMNRQADYHFRGL